MTTLPTPYTPLDVLVARCRLPCKIVYMPGDAHGDDVDAWMVVSDLGVYPFLTANAARMEYLKLRAYLTPAPERGQITDQVV